MVLTRYVLKSLFGVATFIMVVLTLLVMLTQSLRFLELVIEAGAPALDFFELIGLAIPRFLEIILPLSFAASVIFIYNKMTSDNELTVMRAAGFSQRSLMMPALKMAIVGVFIGLCLTLWVTPIANAKLSVLKNDVKTQYASLLLRAGVFNSVEDGLMLYLNDRTSDGTLTGILIHDARDKTAEPATIHAKSGKLITSDDEQTSLIIYNGTRQAYKPKTQTLDILDFDQYTLEITNVNNATKRMWKKPSERTFFELLKKDVREIKNKEAALQFQAERHRRFIQPLTVLTFIALSLACLVSGSFNRRGQSKRIILASILIIAFQSSFLAISEAMDEEPLMIAVFYLLVLIPTMISFYISSTIGQQNFAKLIAAFKNREAS